MSLPTTVTAGDSLSVSVDGGDYTAAAGWAATLRLVPRGAGSAISISGVADGSAWTFAANSAATAAYTAGEYSAAAYATKSGDRHTLDAGPITVRPDPAAIAAGTDTRTQAEVALAAARAALAAWTPTTKSYTIGDVSKTFASPAEIREVITYWQGRVDAERAAADRAAGRPNRTRYYVGFRRA